MASKLQDLINRLCPNGVEYRKLGEVCDVCRGVRVVKSQLSETGKYAVYQNSLKPLGYHSEANCSGGTAFVIGAGAAGEVGYCTEEFWAADDCYYLNGKGKVVGRFLYYVLTSNQGYLASRVRKASIPRLARGFVEDLLIPVPPLEVQGEIVQILDNFAELTAELTAELEKRKKQYEYYRRALLCGGESSGWPMVKLGEVCKVLRGKRLTKAQLSSDYSVPVYHGGLEPLGYYHSFNRPGEMVMVINVGASAGTIGYSRGPFWSSDGCYCLESEGAVNSRYLYNALICEESAIKSRVRVAGIPTLDKTALLDISIPLPPLAEQRRIVSILDRFDRLCNDLTSGLPAEIAARKKQYAYYRDKLLELRVES